MFNKLTTFDVKFALIISPVYRKAKRLSLVTIYSNYRRYKLQKKLNKAYFRYCV